MAPEAVAEAVLAAIKEGAEEICPGDMVSGLRQVLVNDPKGVEKELVGYLPA
jgi:hypothetical protein